MRKAELKSVLRNQLTWIWLLITFGALVVIMWMNTVGVAVIGQQAVFLVTALVTALLAIVIWRKAKIAGEEDGVIVVEEPAPVEVGEKIYLTPLVEDESQEEDG